MRWRTTGRLPRLPRDGAIARPIAARRRFPLSSREVDKRADTRVQGTTFAPMSELARLMLNHLDPCSASVNKLFQSRYCVYLGGCLPDIGEVRRRTDEYQKRLFPRDLGYCSNCWDQSINRVGRCVTISRRFEKTTHHRVTDNEKFAVQNYHTSSGF